MLSGQSHDKRVQNYNLFTKQPNVFTFFSLLADIFIVRQEGVLFNSPHKIPLPPDFGGFRIP